MKNKSSSIPIRIVQYGLGPIGLGTARLALTKKSIQLVGAIDTDPAKVGKDLGELLGLRKKLGIIVSADARRVFKETKPDAVVHCTGSWLPGIFSQLAEIAEARLHCITSSEEMLFPWFKQPALADKLNRIAQKSGMTILGTGVNPGFVMDALPLMLSGASQQVEEIHATRIVDVGTRRAQLQRKVGAGMTVEECQRVVDAGKYGHVGLPESAAILAHAMGWEPAKIKNVTRMLIASRRIKNRALDIPRGYVKGMVQVATATVRGRVRVRLDLEMSADAKDPRDEIVITGTPPLRVVIKGGVAGDYATASVLLNTLPKLFTAPRGVITILDILGPRVIS